MTRDRLADDVVTRAKLAPALRSRLEQLTSGPTTYGFVLWVDPQESLTPNLPPEGKTWWEFESGKEIEPAIDYQRYTESGGLAPVQPFFAEGVGGVETGGATEKVSLPWIMGVMADLSGNTGPRRANRHCAH